MEHLDRYDELKSIELEVYYLMNDEMLLESEFKKLLSWLATERYLTLKGVVSTQNLPLTERRLQELDLTLRRHSTNDWLKTGF